MNTKVVLFLISALVAVSMADSHMAVKVPQLNAATMSANPLNSFQGSCANCVGNFPVCLWCANTGPGCFAPPQLGAACCGCVNTGCYVCPGTSSCATWSPFNPAFCPPPNVNNNSTQWPCNWQTKITLRYQEKAVFRCHSTPVMGLNARVQWNMAPNSDGEFSVWVVDQRNFDLYISGQPFACMNQNCLAGGATQKWGSFVNAGSPGYYFIVTKTNNNFSGTSSYLINASVQ